MQVPALADVDGELPTRVELYRQVNRAERVAREIAEDAVSQLLEDIGWGLAMGGLVIALCAGTRSDREDA